MWTRVYLFFPTSDASFCFKGRCRLEILIINCMCHLHMLCIYVADISLTKEHLVSSKGGGAGRRGGGVGGAWAGTYIEINLTYFR